MAQRRSRRTAAAAAESRIARAVEDESEDSNGSNYGADNNSVSSSDDEAGKKVVEETITEFPKEKNVCDMCEETFWHWRWFQSHMWDAHAKIYRPDWAEPMPSTSKPNDKKVVEQKKKKKLLPPPPNPDSGKKKVQTSGFEEANKETIAKPSVMLKRRRTKSIMPPSKSKAAQ